MAWPLLLQELNSTDIDYFIQGQGVLLLSGHAVYDCSLRQDKHIIQYEHGSKVNMFPSLCL